MTSRGSTEAASFRARTDVAHIDPSVDGACTRTWLAVPFGSRSACATSRQLSGSRQHTSKAGPRERGPALGGKMSPRRDRGAAQGRWPTSSRKARCPAESMVYRKASLSCCPTGHSAAPLSLLGAFIAMPPLSGCSHAPKQTPPAASGLRTARALAHLPVTGTGGDEGSARGGSDLAGPDRGGELLPLTSSDRQPGPIGVLAVAHRDGLASGSRLDAVAASRSATGALAPPSPIHGCPPSFRLPPSPRRPP